MILSFCSRFPGVHRRLQLACTERRLLPTVLVLQFVYHCGSLFFDLGISPSMDIFDRNYGYPPGYPPATLNPRETCNTKERSCPRTSRSAVGK